MKKVERAIEKILVTLLCTIEPLIYSEANIFLLNQSLQNSITQIGNIESERTKNKYLNVLLLCQKREIWDLNGGVKNVSKEDLFIAAKGCLISDINLLLY